MSKVPDAATGEVSPRDSFDRVAAAKRELAALERDAAISLLLETPNVECCRPTWDPTWKRGDRCGTCWACRLDKFLRDVGARR